VIYQVKKFLLVVIATVIGIFTGNQFANMAYASTEFANIGKYSESAEKSKMEFAYELAIITTKLLTTPSVNAENFKAEFAYATAQVTAKLLPVIPNDQRNEFVYDMAQFTTKIINDPNLDVERAKAEFAYKIVRISTKVITSTDKIAVNQKPVHKASETASNPKATSRLANSGANKKASPNSGDISMETYTNLVEELTQVGNHGIHSDHKINVDGEIRYHYAFNRGSGWNYDSSGIRTRIGFNTEVYKDWRVAGMVEGEKNLANFNNKFNLENLNVMGKLGESTLTVGTFGYLMAEGNIYDSTFKGIRADLGGGALKYTLSFGKTDNSSDTYIATARYNDFDYNLETSIYHYKMGNGVNTITTLGGNYNFNDFCLGAMHLGSSIKDSKGNRNGYVFSLNYGDLKTYRPGTYDIFAKYYNQPVGTYIQHGMYGLGGVMQGFKGYEIGTNYTFSNNVVGGIQYFDLSDKVSGVKGKTWWTELSLYF
jgi:hypothetical protein